MSLLSETLLVLLNHGDVLLERIVTAGGGVTILRVTAFKQGAEIATYQCELGKTPSKIETAATELLARVQR